MQSPNKCFAYGTLRPDVLAPWTDIVFKNESFKVIDMYPAHLKFSKLFIGKAHGYPVCVQDMTKYAENDITIGYILVIDKINLALEVLDEIEVYPKEYNRKIVQCHNLNTNESEEAYFYTNVDTDEFIDIEYNCWKTHIEKTGYQVSGN
jgi:gamma-glutamylcyclotransferase (GGCT)/AIG2-like uncharacterized protein YtfP